MVETIEEQIEAQRRRASEAQARANVRIPQRTVKAQFSLGQGAFQAEKQARAVRKQRRMALGEFSLAQSQLRSLEEQRQQQLSQPSSQQRINEAVNQALSSRRGRVGDAFFRLSKEERAEATRIIGEAEDQAERNIGRYAVSKIESQAAQSLTPELRKSIVTQAIETGKVNLTLKSNLVLPSTSSNQFQTLGTSSNQFQSLAPSKESKRGGLLTPIVNKITSSKYYEPVKEKFFPKPKPTEFAIATFGEDKAQRIAGDVLTIGKAGALSFVGTSRLPKVSSIPTRTNLQDPLKIGFQETVVEKGIPRSQESYQIFAERKAPAYVIDTTKSGGALGTGKNFPVSPSKYELTQTVFPATEKSATTLSTKTGKRFELDILTGTSRKVKADNLGRLPSTQEYLLKNLAVQKTGRPLMKSYIYDNKAGLLGRTDSYKKLSNKESRQLVRDILKKDEINIGNVVKENQGSLKRINIKGQQESLSIKKTRLKPSEYADYLTRQGKLKFREVEDLGISEGRFYGSRSKKYPDLIEIRKDLKGNARETTIAHELIHHKTPNKNKIINFLDKKLPYKLKPSEIIARGLEKRFARTGFKAEIPISRQLSQPSTSEVIRTPAKLGKTTSRTETVSTSKVILETDAFELYKGKTLFKDVSRPFARGSGRVPKLRELTLVRKEPRIIGENPKDIKITVEGGSNFKIYKPTGEGRRTPLSVTFGKQELIQVPKPVPKFAKQPRTPKAKTTLTTRSPKLSGASSLLVGVSNRGASSYNYGTDTLGSSFGRGFGKGFQDLSLSQKSSAFSKEQPLSISRNIPLETNIPKFAQFSLNLPRSVPKEIARNVPRNVPREIVRNVPREIARQIPRQVPRQIPRQVPKQPTRDTRLFNTKFPLSRTPSPPKLPLPKINMGGKSKGIFGKGKQITGYTPSVVGSVRFNVLGEKVKRKKAKLLLGLPTIRGVLE